MSLATTCPWGPTWRAACNVWLPAPLARSSTREPTMTPAMASMASVAGSIQVATVASQRAQPGAALSHCARISDCTMSRLSATVVVSLPCPPPNAPYQLWREAPTAEAMLARPTARNQYRPVQNTIEPLDLDEGILLEQRDEPINRDCVVSRRARNHRRRFRTAPLADEVHRHVIEVAVPISRLDDEVTVVTVRAESVRHQLWRRSPLRQVVADAEDRDSTGSDALVEVSQCLADRVVTEQVRDGVVGTEHDVESRSVNRRAPTHVRDREVNGQVALSRFATSALHGRRR